MEAWKKLLDNYVRIVLFVSSTGFEKDVFKVVQEYFLSLEEPLIPFRLFPFLVEILDKAEKKDRVQLNTDSHHSQVIKTTTKAIIK